MKPVPMTTMSISFLSWAGPVPPPPQHNAHVVHAVPARGCVPRWPGVAVCVLRWLGVYAAFRNPTRLQKDPGSSFHDSPHFRGFHCLPPEQVRSARVRTPSDHRAPGGSGGKVRRTWRRGLSALRSTRTRDCHVPRATRPPSTGRVTEGQTSTSRRWSAQCPADPWAVPVPPVVRREPLQRGRQVVSDPEPSLHESQAGRGVRRRHVHQAVTASGAEPFHFDDPPPGTCRRRSRRCAATPLARDGAIGSSSPAVPLPACQVRAKNSMRCGANWSACVRNGCARPRNPR